MKLPASISPRPFWLAFLGLFIPLVVPALFLPVMSSLPEPLGVVVWLWVTFFAGWQSNTHPATLALLYTALSLAFGIAAGAAAKRFGR